MLLEEDNLSWCHKKICFLCILCTILRPLCETSFLHDKLIWRQRQFAQAFAGGIKDRVGDGGGHADDADFADAATTQTVDVRVGHLDKLDLNARHVAVDRDVIVGQIAGIRPGLFHSRQLWET